MKHILLILSSFLSFSGLSQILIDSHWQFKTGDSLVWKNTDYNSTKWNNITTDIIWEKQGYIDYNGFAWYRKTVFLPLKLKNETLKLGGMTLNLGTIDDCDQVFFNGKLIGESGVMPPNFLTAYDKIRKYDILASDVRWGKPNVIAVRVFDNSGGGGITGQEVSLKMGELGSSIKIEAVSPISNHIFINTPEITISINLSNLSPYVFKGKVEFCLFNDFNDTISSSTQNVDLKKNHNVSTSYKTNNLQPGFYKLNIRLKSKLFNSTEVFRFGVDPEKIATSPNKPLDFDNFWSRAKRELTAVAPQFRMIYNDSLSTKSRDVFLVEMRSLDNVLIRGWYARPKAPGRYPAILHLQGYSSNQQMSWGYDKDDMAVFVLNIRGHGNSRDDINPGFPGFLLTNVKDKERYIYRGVFMDCIRAIDFLYSRDEIDKKFIVVEGGSQGGALSLATAALDYQRVTLCIAAVPFLSDFQDYFKIAVWPANEFESYMSKNPEFGWERLLENLSYFDIRNLTSMIKCPVFMSVGLKDIVCPPRINFAVYNQILSSKNYLVYPESGHGLPPDYNKTKYEWMKNELTKLQSSK
ncbi:MAG: alpha/beta fold hydrolase [Bacteroidales bacterium]|nr:alpha/beta fold hydrolase [Bacteroidales bacterium]